MRRILTAFLAAIAFTLAQPARAATNLLPDGGFESGQWKRTRWDNGDGELEFSGEARTGRQAAKLTGISEAKARVNLLAHSPPVDVQAGREYVLSLFHRSDGQATPTVSILACQAPWAAAQEGVTGAVHWRLSPPSANDDAWLIAVNPDQTTTAEATLPLAKLKLQPKDIIFGDGMATATKNGLMVTLPPMGTLATTVKMAPANR